MNNSSILYIFYNDVSPILKKSFMVSTITSFINIHLSLQRDALPSILFLRHLMSKSISHCQNHKNEDWDITFPDTSLESPGR